MYLKTSAWVGTNKTLYTVLFYLAMAYLMTLSVRVYSICQMTSEQLIGNDLV